MKKIKIILLSIALLSSILIFIVWANHGYNYFTKDKAYIEFLDPITNLPYFEWKDETSIGLIDFVLPALFIESIILLVIYFIIKKRRIKNVE